MQKEYSIVSSHHDKLINFDFRKSEIDNQPLIILIHGFKGFKDWGHFNLIADYLNSKGYNVIKINFSHNGTSKEQPLDFVDLEGFGNNNFSIELNDLDDLLNHIFEDNNLKQRINLSKIILLGHSRGGSTAIIKANEDIRITSVITWGSPLNILERYGKENLKWKKENVQFIYNGRTKQNMPLFYQFVENINENHNRFNIYSILDSTKTPTLIVHSIEDLVIPYQEVEQINSNPKVKTAIIKYGSHTFDGIHPFENNFLPKASKKALEESLIFIRSVIQTF